MPFGPDGERCAAATVVNVSLVADTATANFKDEYVNPGQSGRWRMAQAKGRRSE